MATENAMAVAADPTEATDLASLEENVTKEGEYAGGVSPFFYFLVVTGRVETVGLSPLLAPRPLVVRHGHGSIRDVGQF